MTTTNAELIAEAKRTQDYSRGYIRSLARSLADALEAATTTLDLVREARGNHPKCDRYDDDGVSCGWKSVVLDIDAALSHPEEAS